MLNFTLNKKNHFIGLGAKKCASSWIFKQLIKHPEIYIHPEKELNFFNNKFEINNYHEKFKKFDGIKIYGEISPDYFTSKLASERIRNEMPKTKLFVVLRNPIERALSHYKFSKFINTIDQSISFLKAWDLNINKIKTIGHYLEHIENFKKKDFKIFIYNDLEENSLSFIQSIFEFLNVDHNFIPDNFNQKYYPSGGKNLSSCVYEEFSKSFSIDTQTFKLLNRYYKKHIEDLEKYLNRDLESWKNV